MGKRDFLNFPNGPPTYKIVLPTLKQLILNVDVEINITTRGTFEDMSNQSMWPVCQLSEIDAIDYI